MNLKKNWAKHLLMLMILGIFGILAAGSTIDAYGKGMKAYQAGDYAKAKKIWSESPDVKNANSNDSIEALWYLGEIYQQEGDEEKALECKAKAYNATVGSNYTLNKIQEKKADLWEKMSTDSLIASAQKKQAAEKAVKKAAGTWSMFRCQYDGKKYDTGKLKAYPTKIVLNENGTGTMYWEGANNVNFNWSSDNGYMSFSGTDLNIKMNKQGYIVCACAAIKWDNFGIIWADFFFEK